MRCSIQNHPLLAHVEAGLASALVLTGLQADHCVATLANLFFGEFAFVFIRHLGSESFKTLVHRQASEGAETQADLFDVPGLEQVDRLEDLVIWHAELLHEFLESSVVLHQLEIAAFRVDPFHTAWQVLVGQFAQQNTILQDLFERLISRYFLTSNLLDPIKDLSLNCRVGSSLSQLFEPRSKSPSLKRNLPDDHGRAEVAPRSTSFHGATIEDAG